jgi:hypothetical protein
MRERHDLGDDGDDLAVGRDGCAIGKDMRGLTLPDQEHRHYRSIMRVCP